jgi:transposase
LTREERELKRDLEALVRALAPALLAEPGVGPIAAAQIVIAWSHRGRFRSEAAFARLGGAAPIPASSGQGDRPTIAYVERRLREGKSVREAIRCLKRYLAHHLFRVLEGAPLAA